MKAISAPMAVADYCQAMALGKIIVNTHYQRNEGLWTSAARSYFIESILLQYPIPKLFLYAKLDLRTRETIKEIVDGQQRSNALIAFFNGKLALSKTIDTPELRGMRYNRLSDEWKTSFLTYQLPIDQFAGTPEDEVREAFRRINSNNAPLNAEEQRNARFQGEFKWFINSIAEVYKEQLLSVGLMTKRDSIRMTDLRLYAEISHALDSGFQTVKGVNLDKLYKKYNVAFDAGETFRAVISYGIDYFLNRPEFHTPAFLRMHVFQSIVLAAISLKFPNFETLHVPDGQEEFSERVQALNFGIESLAGALGDPEASPQLNDFIHACTEATNTGSAKWIRYFYFRVALGN